MKIYFLTFSLFFSISIFCQDTITIKGHLIQDAYLNSQSSEPDGTKKSLVGAEWTYFGDYGYTRSLIQFDLTDIPAFSLITQAQLSLFHNPTSGHDGHSNLGGDNSWIIMRVAESWKDDEVTWSSQPLTTNTNWNILNAPDSDDRDYPNINVTKMVQDMINRPDLQHGFMIKLLEENALYRSVVFGSVDHPDPKLRPMLFIEYQLQPIINHVLTVKPGPDKGKDAYINLVHDAPEGDQSSLVASVWTHSGSQGKGRSLLAFQLPQFPDNKEIYRVELNLYHDPNSGHQGHSRMGGSNELLVQRITEPWDEHSVHWSKQPETTSEHEITVNPSNLNDQQYLQIDVTELIKDMLENPEESFGFMLRLADEEVMYRSVVFGSSDNTDPTLWPDLVIYYGQITSQFELQALSIDFNVYPNPGNSFFILDVGREVKEYLEVLIYDQHSRQVGSLILKSRSTKLDLKGLPNGIYFIQMQSKNQTIVKKVVKAG